MSEERPPYGTPFLHDEFLPHALAEIQSTLRRLQEEAKVHSSRELSLAITKLEEGLMWLRRAG